jgi:16S rRNA (guanine(966)-N(2))-methyltransferase RsmD
MKVITGKARGTILKTLDGLDVRPTTDMTKGAIFNAIQFEIEGRTVLDLFAGSGQLGIEALSRGAARATFVDQSRKSIEVVKQNLEKTKLSDLATVKLSDAVTFINTTDDFFDIAFLDPPYNKGIIESVLPLLSKKMSKFGKIICEHDYIEKLPESVADFKIVKEYKHGRSVISVYRRENYSE